MSVRGRKILQARSSSSNIGHFQCTPYTTHRSARGHASGRAIALLKLQSHFFAGTVRADGFLEIQSAAGLACAVRRHRGLESGVRECESQRTLEIAEGTTRYAAAAVPGRFSGAASKDFLSRALTAAKTPRSVSR
jgi:hypothetical protein